MGDEVYLLDGGRSLGSVEQGLGTSPSKQLRVKRRKTQTNARTESTTKTTTKTRSNGGEENGGRPEVGKDEQILRFACSRVAQLCGLCNFPQKADLVQLVLDLVYQDLAYVLKSDCDRLGIEIVSEEEDMRRVLNMLSAKSQEVLKTVRTRTLNSTGDVQISQKKVRAVLEEEVKRAVLPEGELQRLSEQLIRNTNKRFGIAHEDKAIDIYEEIHPDWKVKQRNALSYLWPFTVESSSTEDTVKTKKVPAALRCLAVSPSEIHECIEVFGRPETLFFLCGAVDGVAKHTKQEHQIPDRVVEVKHRVQQFKTPPPFYEIVQLTCYLRMLELKEGLLIQCLRTETSSSQDEARCNQPVQVNIQTDTVTLNEMHETGWNTTVLPRLQELAEFVYSLRKNDTDRLVFLANATQFQCAHLAEKLPFLSHLC